MNKQNNPVSAISCDTSPDVQINLNIRGLKPSATVAINEKSNELIKTGRKIYKLGLGQSPFPVPQPVIQALQVNAFQKDYLPVKGLWELRETIAEHHQRSFGIECSAEDVLIGPGSKELMFLIQLVYYGDLVIPTPSWVSYVPQAKIIGRQIRLLHTKAENNWRLTAEQLDQYCSEDPQRPRLLILNYPSNPTGKTYPPEELADLAEVARKYRILLLSDEIYGKIHHKGLHQSIVPMYPEGTVFSGGLSKWCGAGGWRLGLFVFPGCLRWLQEAMAVAASETFTSTSSPIQFAAIKAFEENPDIDLYLTNVRKILNVLGSELAGILNKSGIKTLAPDGGFYLFPDFSPFRDKLKSKGIHNSSELCEKLLEEAGVAILPGSEFGQPEDALTVRLAYVNFDGDQALQAVNGGEEPDDAFLKQYCGDTLNAVATIADWIQA